MQSKSLSFKTAISRSKPSAPAQWLSQHCVLPDPMLDFGCGKGFDADWFECERYDPHYFPDIPRRKYRTIICIYVFNTLHDSQHDTVLNGIKQLLLPNGTAYIAVRNDLKNLRGYTKTGTYQCVVELDLPVLVENSGFKIYKYEKDI